MIQWHSHTNNKSHISAMKYLSNKNPFYKLHIVDNTQFRLFKRKWSLSYGHQWVCIDHAYWGESA